MSQDRAGNGGAALADDVRYVGRGASDGDAGRWKGRRYGDRSLFGKVGQTETMEPGNGDALPADFFTIYNFYGLVDGSVNTPDGWKFTSEESGRTPAMGGYPLVLPMDIPGTPNITWTATALVKPGTEVTGFSAVTRVGATTDGMYSAMVTQRSGPIQGASGSPGSATMVSKQAQIGMITTPSFLADLKK